MADNFFASYTGSSGGGGMVSSVFGRTGAVVAVLGDYSADLITYDNTGSGLTATDVQAAIDELAASITSGTVTSVALAMPSIFSVSGSPVTTSGTLTASLTNQSANLVFAGPATGSPADPTFRALVAADIPALSYQPIGNYITDLTGEVTASGPGSVAASISANAVTNAKLAQMAAHTFKGNNTALAADPIDLTQAELTAELNAFTDTLQGVVPASGGGTSNFLRADGTWTAPDGTGSNTTLSNLTATVAINQNLFFDVTNTRIIGDTTNYPASVTAGGVNADLTAGMGVRDFAGGNAPVFTMANRTLPDGTTTVASLASGNSTTVANQRIAAIMSRNFSGSTPTGMVTLQSGNQSGTANSGDILLRIGTVSSGTRGNIRFIDASTAGASIGDVWTITNTSTGAGQWQSLPASSDANQALSNLTNPTSINRTLTFGPIIDAGIKTQDEPSATTADIFVKTGDAATAGSGVISISSGTAASGSNTGDINIFSANADSADSGFINMFSGEVSSGTGSSGGLNIASGAVQTGANPSGEITLFSGDQNGTGDSGALTISSGDSSAGASGDVSISTGTAGTTRGDVNITAENIVLTAATTINANSSTVLGLADGSFNSTGSLAVNVKTFKARMGMMKKIHVDYNAFTAAATTEQLTIHTLAAGWAVKSAVMKSTASFTGGSVASATMSLGITSSPSQIIPAGLDVFAAPSGTLFVSSTSPFQVFDFGASTAIIIELNTSGDDINNLTAGGVDIWIELQNLNDVNTDQYFP